MCPGFDSWTRSHMWVEFVVGSRPCTKGFSPDSPVYLPPQKPTFLNCNSIGNLRATGLWVEHCCVSPLLSKVDLFRLTMTVRALEALFFISVVSRYSWRRKIHVWYPWLFLICMVMQICCKCRRKLCLQIKCQNKFLPFYHLFIYFKDLFTERACPQLAKANLGGPCLNKQITKEKKKKNIYIYIYTNKN